MNDYIDRQAAIRWIKTECNPYGKPTIDYESGVKVIDHIETMPSAEVEPVKHGRWTKIGHIEHTWLVSKCSECSYQTIDAGNYCTNCGAKMDLEEGENHD